MQTLFQKNLVPIERRSYRMASVASAHFTVVSLMVARAHE
jgi:hypothetical protein